MSGIKPTIKENRRKLKQKVTVLFLLTNKITSSNLHMKRSDSESIIMHNHRERPTPETNITAGEEAEGTEVDSGEVVEEEIEDLGGILEGLFEGDFEEDKMEDSGEEITEVDIEVIEEVSEVVEVILREEVAEVDIEV
jgi:hypothetical protein